MQASRLNTDTPSALPPGTRLHEFEVLSVLGVGGFGIVYLAFDHALEREVAIKEYMPAALAGRTETLHVSLRSQTDAEIFELGLQSFIKEAKMLARFDHPSLLKVHRFWPGNGTAYMAMPVLRGRTVKDVRLEMVGPPDEAWLRALLDPLLGAIETLHAADVYHRDIAPDNIQIEPGGRPVLLDFGAARRVLSDKSQALTAILKPAYAPIEQYAEANSVKQGPWTDIYALGATLHFLLLTRPPAPATTRTVHDDPSALTVQMLPGCSPAFLQTIDWMLAPLPGDRPQSVAALREVLEGRVPPPVRRQVPVASQWDRTEILAPLAAPPAPASGQTTRIPQPAADTPVDPQATVVIPPPAPVAAVEPVAPIEAAGAAGDGFAAPPVDVAAPRPAAARSKLLAFGLVGAVLLLGGLAAVLWPRAAPAPAVVAEPAASAPVAAPLPPMASMPESHVTTVTVAGSPPPPAAAAPAAPPPVDKPAAPPATAAALPAAVAATPKPAPRPTPTPTARAPAAAPAAAPALPPTVAEAAPEPPRQPPAPAPAAPAAVTEPPKPVVAGPEARCAGRNPISHFVCMERECLRSELAGHADCQKWRASAKRD